MKEIANRNKESNLPFVIIAGILSVILWRLPFANLVLFPFNMFVTYLHEASHGLMAIITGGHLLRFQMELDTSGLAYTSGGIRFLVISAGYLGSSFWGAMLLIAAFKKGTAKPILIVLSVFFLIFTALFARNMVAVAMGLFFSFSMYMLQKIKNTMFLSTFLAFLAVQSCFQSLNDILTLVFLSGTQVQTDALNMSNEVTGGLVPPIIFALLWGIISLTFFLFALKIALYDRIKFKQIKSKISLDL